MQYPGVIYLKVIIPPNMCMDKRETRRLALKSLVDSLGRGGVAAVAAKIGKAPDYVSRMLYEQGKVGRKGIGEDTWDALVAAYPVELGTAPTGSREVPHDKRSDSEAAVDELKRQVESLTIILASLAGVTTRHRPLEGEELARVIRGNQSLDLVRHDLAADILNLIEASAKRAVRARK